MKGDWLKDGTLHAQAAMPAPAPTTSPAVALVLGGGGLRDYAHIGVLRALEEADIRPDLVVGTSIGAIIIGAAYATGNRPDQLWQEANSMRVRSLADITLRGPGFVKGEALSRWANALVGDRSIERIPIRFAAVAADLDRSLPYVITQDDVGEAPRASAAIPGVLLPVHTSGHTLVDGGVTSLVPVHAARALGTDVVIAVDIYCQWPQYRSNSALSMVLRVSQAKLAPSADGVHVTYQTHASPGGSIPNWLANQTVVDTPYGTLKPLRNNLQEGR